MMCSFLVSINFKSGLLRFLCVLFSRTVPDLEFLLCQFAVFAYFTPLHTSYNWCFFKEV